jgi:hypothetical protein
VFAGGASLEAIETVCDAVDIGLPVLDGLQELGRVPWIFVAGSCRSVRCLTD